MSPDESSRLPAPGEPPLLQAPATPLLLAPARPWPGLLQRRPHVVIPLALAAIVLLLFLAGWWMHHHRAKAAEDADRAARDRLPLVVAVRVTRSAPLGEMLLPGTLSPLTEASVYARATGYVSRRYVDLGDAVRKDQLLAQIDSPELDQQKLQAIAATAQARQQLDAAIASVGDAQARLDAARTTLVRYRTLLAQDSIARQDVDTQQQVADSDEALLKAAHANVGAAQEGVRAAQADQRRVEALQRYESVRAPFDGIVTSRGIDEGALISGTGAGLVGGGSVRSTSGSNGSATTSSSTQSTSGGSSTDGSTSSSSGGGVEMFHIAQIGTLRVYVNVPQESATLVRTGTPASVMVEQRGEPVVGAVVRTSHALDPSARTLLAEVQIPNGAQQLLPGMFAQVRFTDPRPDPPPMVSGETLITRAQGTEVAVLEPPTDAERQHLGKSPDARCARRVRLQPVALGRDYGTQVEIVKGLRDGEFVVLNPGDMVRQDALLLPQLQSPEEAAGNDQRGGKAAGPDDGRKKDGGDRSSQDKDRKKSGSKADGGQDEMQQRRARADRDCIEQQAAAQSAAASAPQAAASVVRAGAPTDKTPAGIGSPGMQAPTQGAGKKR